MSDQSKFLGYRSGHSMGFGCAGIEEEAARLRRDLSEAVEVLRRVLDRLEEVPIAMSGVDADHAAQVLKTTERARSEVAALLAKHPP